MVSMYKLSALLHSKTHASASLGLGPLHDDVIVATQHVIDYRETRERL